MADTQKLASTLETLKKALKQKAKADPVIAAGIAKCFETAFEYAWKFMKQTVNENGLEAYSPRDAIKAAGKTNLIEDVDLWLGFLEDRNLSVHDYIGISNEEYLRTIRQFLVEAQKLLSKAD